MWKKPLSVPSPFVSLHNSSEVLANGRYWIYEENFEVLKEAKMERGDPWRVRAQTPFGKPEFPIN